MMQVETHCHTKDVSICGKVSAVDAVRLYDRAGYKMIILTDHYYEYFWDSPKIKRRPWEKKIEAYLAGYRAAKEMGEKLGITVLQGMEIQFDQYKPYDFLVYGPDEQFLLDHPYLNQLSPAEFHGICLRNDFLMFQAHPYRYDKAPVQPIVYDGIEVYNAHPRHNSHNRLAVHFAREHGLKLISGSDFHKEEDCGRGGIMLPEDIRTMREFIDYYKENSAPELIITFEGEPRKEDLQ